MPIQLATLLCLVILAGCSTHQEPAAADFAFLQVTVVDLKSGITAPNQTVLIKNGRITEVAPFETTVISSRAQTVFAKDKFLAQSAPGYELSGDELEAIKPGNRAHLILLEGNPLDSNTTAEFLGAYINGAYFSSAYRDSTDVESLFKRANAGTAETVENDQ